VLRYASSTVTTFHERGSLLPAIDTIEPGLIAKELKITQRAALGLVAELNIREVTGRGRYRAWGVM
jgi:hypothetical protein